MEPFVPGTRFDRWRERYRSVALFTFNALLLLALFNLALHAAFAVADAVRRHDRPEARMGGYVGKLKDALPELSEADVRQVMRETEALTYSYEPFTQFRDRSQRGRFVNVDLHGFRHSTGQEPWPPSPERYNVFFFGGSTSFGWGLPDGHTIPSQFHQLVPRAGGRPVAVYNFSRGAYFSTQERILFEQLLLAGHKPDAAIFVDGLNDLHWREGRPLYDERFAALLEESPRLWSREWPMLRLAGLLRNRVPLARAASERPPTGDAVRAFQDALARYLTNKKLIESAAAASGVVPAFVWQPVPSYQHEGRRYLARFRGSVPWRVWRLDDYVPVYQRVEELSRAGELGSDFLWCGGVQQGRDELFYIDLVHYHPRLSQMVAQCIASQMRDRGLLPPAGTPPGTRSSAAARSTG